MDKDGNIDAEVMEELKSKYGESVMRITNPGLLAGTPTYTFDLSTMMTIGAAGMPTMSKSCVNPLGHSNSRTMHRWLSL